MKALRPTTQPSSSCNSVVRIVNPIVEPPDGTRSAAPLHQPLVSYGMDSGCIINRVPVRDRVTAHWCAWAIRSAACEVASRRRCSFLHPSFRSAAHALARRELAL